MRNARTVLLGVILHGLISLMSALDVEVTSYECNQSLPITADFSILCEGKKRCTFGNSTAQVTGTLNYNEVYNTGMENNVGYMSTDVELFTLTYNFNDMMAVPLCSEYLTAEADDQGECPSDGAYAFDVSYDLPSAGKASTSWLASGWTGSGLIRIFAEQDETAIIGSCSFNLKAYVTPTASRGFFQTPSASSSAVMVVGAFAAVTALCFWCYCCAKKKQKISETPEDSKSTKDDISTFFKRLDDDTKTHMSSACPSNYGRADGDTVEPESGESTEAHLTLGGGEKDQKRKWFSRFKKNQDSSETNNKSLLSKLSRKKLETAETVEIA